MTSPMLDRLHEEEFVRKSNLYGKITSMVFVGVMVGAIGIGAISSGTRCINDYVTPTIESIVDNYYIKSRQTGFRRVHPYVKGINVIDAVPSRGIDYYIKEISKKPEVEELLGKSFEKGDLIRYLEKINNITPEKPYIKDSIKIPNFKSNLIL